MVLCGHILGTSHSSVQAFLQRRQTAGKRVSLSYKKFCSIRHYCVSTLLNNKLRHARSLLLAGDVIGARKLCLQILGKAPRNPEALTMMGIAALRTDAPREAAQHLRGALAGNPRAGEVLEYLGLALLNLGDFVEAEKVLGRATTIPGAPASAWMRHGLAVLELGRAREAVGLFERAVALAPREPDVHVNLGRALALSGNPAEAATCFGKALEAAPGHVDALFNLGVLEMKAQRPAAAAQWFERVLGVIPQHPDTLINLGVIADGNNDPQRALELFRQAATANPANAHALAKFGNALARAGQHALAYRHLHAAASAQPRLIEAVEGLAHACAALGRFKEAATYFEQVLLLEPENPAIAAGLAGTLLQLGNLDAAQRHAEQATRADPQRPTSYQVLADVHFFRKEPAAAVATLEQGYAKTSDGTLLGLLAAELRRTCQWDRWNRLWPELDSRLNGGECVGGPFALLAQPTTAEQQLDYARRWAARFTVAVPPHPQRRQPVAEGRRYRIGYLSADFHEHATAYLMAGLLERHDRNTFEIFAYSYGPDDHSPMRARLRAACEHFADIAWDPDDVAVQRIRDDQLDILIDLKGYTMGSRSALLAARPCAVQVSWLGYPGTMGASFIDYLIADREIVPPRLAAHYSEYVVHMPHTYQPNDRSRTVADALSRADYGLPENAFVFCCFNQAYKISPDLFACWMRLLRQVESGVLWLLEDNPVATQNLRAAAAVHGVAPGRLVIAPRLPLPQHLARYCFADLALDTFPYTSHTTASDALWCGCPLVGLRGSTFASRVSASILAACGLPDLVTHTLPQYEQKIIALATDRTALTEVKSRIAAAREHSPLFDATAFTHDFEQILIAIHSRAYSIPP